MEQSLVIRGREVTSQDIDLIGSLVNQYQRQGRTFISRELCRIWNWHQPNGALKDMACRELLRRLDQKGLIHLPAKKIDINRRRKRLSPHLLSPEIHPLTGKLKDFLPIALKMVRGSPEEALHNSLICRYHSLGYGLIVGAHLKYLASIQGHPVACLSWEAAAWKISCRDQFIGWSPSTRSKNLFLIVNNTRFLILPWIHIPHLASHLLSQPPNSISNSICLRVLLPKPL